MVVIVGLVVLGVAFYLFAKAYQAKFQNTLNLTTLSAQVKKAVIFLGRLGYGAVGITITSPLPAHNFATFLSLNG